MNNKIIKFSRKSAPEKSARMVETIVGCKWSLTVYNLLNNNINRPGEMVRSVEGLTTKVLNSCLKRNIEFGILEREIFNETPPRRNPRLLRMAFQELVQREGSVFLLFHLVG